MKRTLLATASAVMLLGTSAMAADTTARTSAEMRLKTEAGAELQDSLVGYDVVDRTGDDVGDIERVIMGANGKPSKAIASVGGFLGFNDKRVEIDLSDATIDHRDDEVRVYGWTDAQLEALPDYDLEDMARDRNAYYRDELRQRDRLVGYDIIDAEGDDIGDVEQVMFDRYGKPTRVVASVGGFLGINDKRIELDLRGKRVNHTDEEIHVTGWTDAEIEALPDYDVADLDYERTMQLRTDALMIERLIGYDIIDADGNDIGDVKEVTVDENGKAIKIVAAVGGFLGINDKRAVIDLDDATINHSKDEVRVRGWTDAQLEALPDYTG